MQSTPPRRSIPLGVWLLLVTALSAGLVVALTRGSPRQIGTLRPLGAPLLLLGLVIQAVLEYITFPRNQIETVGYGLLMLSYALILAFCISNIATRGFGVIAIGVAMNALVIGLNLGMPTKPIGNDSHGNRIFKPVEQTVKHRQAMRGDLLSFLGDRILFPKPFDTVVSFGDLVISVGICELAYYASRRARTPMLISKDGHASREPARAQSGLARHRHRPGQ
jgi:Family of unknown function (DUF5317)